MPNAVTGGIPVSIQWPGGWNNACGITAATVIKVGYGTLFRVIVLAPGSGSGALTINDCATTGAATSANTIYSAPGSGLTASQVIELEFPCALGIVVSAVPAGSPLLAVSFV